MAEIYYPPIRTNQDLALAYTVIRQGIVEQFSPELAVAIKRAIRRYNRRTYDTTHKMVEDHGDSYTVLVQLPEGIKSHDEAETYFKLHEEMEPVFTLYDCTGLLFTSWYKLFQRHGQWYAYHHICKDV